MNKMRGCWRRSIVVQPVRSDLSFAIMAVSFLKNHDKIGLKCDVHQCSAELFFLSHLQMVPSSQAATRMLPSREKLVCLTAELHFMWNKVDFLLTGTSVSRSKTNIFPVWLPTASNFIAWSSSMRMNQMSHSVISKVKSFETRPWPLAESLIFHEMMLFSQDFERKMLLNHLTLKFIR